MQYQMPFAFGIKYIPIVCSFDKSETTLKLADLILRVGDSMTLKFVYLSLIQSL